MNEKFRTIGLDTEDKIAALIFNPNDIFAFIFCHYNISRYMILIVRWLFLKESINITFNLCDIFSTYDEANEYYKSLAHSGIKPLSEQVEECKSQLIDEVDLRVSTMVPNVLNIKVWYKNCLIIEHLTQFDVQYINNGAAG